MNFVALLLSLSLSLTRIDALESILGLHKSLIRALISLHFFHCVDVVLKVAKVSNLSSSATLKAVHFRLQPLPHPLTPTFINKSTQRLTFAYLSTVVSFCNLVTLSLLVYFPFFCKFGHDRAESCPLSPTHIYRWLILVSVPDPFAGQKT